MRKLTSLCLVALAAWLLASCSDNKGTGADVDSSGARGSLMQNPPLRIASLNATDFTTQISATANGPALLQLIAGITQRTSNLILCGVDFHYIQYGTVGGAGEATTASGALMVPTGSSAPCAGPRPILLYAHGTSTDRNMNIADITNPNNAEGALIAAMFAAQGFIVVAPNYAGYDSSPLPYHPFLNGDQQSKEMIDALTAARKALGHIFASGTTDSGKLFITGYSQGGYVAMATHRAMQAIFLQNTQDTTLRVTASAPMSGPYALEAFGDKVFRGAVNHSATIFAPMIATSYQRSPGNIYASPTDTTNLFAAAFAPTIDALLPNVMSVTALVQAGKLPADGALFSTTAPTGTTNDPFFAANTGGFGFGTDNLIINSARVHYVEDTFTNPDGFFPNNTTGVPAAATGDALRGGLNANDLRNWHPQAPVLLCGGANDPTVFFDVDTGAMANFWSAEVNATLVTVLDLDATPAGPFALLMGAFQQQKQQLLNAAGQAEVDNEYHTLVAPFCTAAVLGFFLPQSL